ncbi:hypothetical protein E2C01_038278 [Portunus trituberculatus]|uniref:Uncharacterized protein n=1 Tax=Portunus trituberculatus TaxID=210409 RepID=A0A5B7FBS9_PORTR|nr:hypothetical protein [Portunus trituberculatus]
MSVCACDVFIGVQGWKAGPAGGKEEGNAAGNTCIKSPLTCPRQAAVRAVNCLTTDEPIKVIKGGLEAAMMEVLRMGRLAAALGRYLRTLSSDTWQGEGAKEEKGGEGKEDKEGGLKFLRHALTPVFVESYRTVEKIYQPTSEKEEAKQHYTPHSNVYIHHFFQS